jgi:hypothetical protein
VPCAVPGRTTAVGALFDPRYADAANAALRPRRSHRAPLRCARPSAARAGRFTGVINS